MRALSRHVGTLAAITLISLGQHSGSVAAATTLMLRAGTVSQLINAVNTANRSHQPTLIRVSAGHYEFTSAFSNPSYGPSVLPLIGSTITLIGASPSNTTLDAQGFGRLFTVTQAGQLTLHNLTITGGAATSCNDDPSCPRKGGGALFNLGKVTSQNVVFAGNIAVPVPVGVGSPSGDNYGGALDNYEGKMDLEETTITGNGVFGVGGGLAAMGGVVILKDCLVQGNFSNNESNEGDGASIGSGIYVNTEASVTVENSTITGNGGGTTDGQVVALGLGIYANGGTVLIENSAITENVIPLPAQVGGFNVSPGAGGGIYNAGANMTIRSSTIGGNLIGTMGGGIYNSGALTLQGVTITDNTSLNDNGVGVDFLVSFGCQSVDPPQNCVHGGAGLANFGTVSIATSVIAGNNFPPLDTTDTGLIGTDCGGPLQSNGRNAIGDPTGCTLKPSSALKGQPTHDLQNVNPKLSDLIDDGVPGYAHYTPQSASPLIHAGGPVGQFCTAQDQIGDSRPHNVCDIGAIQFPGTAK
jgi:hypothetical protein